MQLPWDDKKSLDSSLVSEDIEEEVMMAKNPQTGPKDVFIHLLAIILLYLSAINLGILVYQYINIFFPDPLIDYFDPSSYYGTLRWSLATLVVGFPAYVWVSWWLEKEYLKFPEKRELKTRKWLLNFTLFVTALVIIGDLIAVLYRFLDGEVTVRFGLKVVTILVIAASVFVYYYWNLKSVEKQKNQVMRWFVGGTILVVTAAIVNGFWLAGSPQAQRMNKYDQRRLSDLQNVQWQVINYWQSKNRLPENLSQLQDDISGYRAPMDPQSGSEYEYAVKGQLEFELCANFQTESKATTPSYPKVPPAYPGETAQNWAHRVGRACFSRTIDPELYKSSNGKDVMPAVR